LYPQAAGQRGGRLIGACIFSGVAPRPLIGFTGGRLAPR
jgi:hypothetical protein